MASRPAKRLPPRVGGPAIVAKARFDVRVVLLWFLKVLTSLDYRRRERAALWKRLLHFDSHLVGESLMRIRNCLLSSLFASLSLATAQGAFIVEPDNAGAPVGKANDHFAATPATGFSLTATPSAAVGLTGNESAFGNPANATGPDRYTLSYTPGPDADNTAFNVGDPLGNSEAIDGDSIGPNLPTYTTVPQVATGLVGGGSGIYNVYFTTPPSTNVNPLGSIITINSDVAPVVLNPVNMNDGNTGPDEVAGTPFTGGANSRWLKIATVPLTAGTTYTVVIEANAATFVSQRTAGVMWEFVGPVPEPSTLALASLCMAGWALSGSRRRVSARSFHLSASLNQYRAGDSGAVFCFRGLEGA